MSAYFKTGTRHTPSGTLLVYLRHWLPAHRPPYGSCGPASCHTAVSCDRSVWSSIPHLGTQQVACAHYSLFFTFPPIWLAVIRLHQYEELLSFNEGLARRLLLGRRKATSARNLLIIHSQKGWAHCRLKRNAVVLNLCGWDGMRVKSWHLSNVRTKPLVHLDQTHPRPSFGLFCFTYYLNVWQVIFTWGHLPWCQVAEVQPGLRQQAQTRPTGWEWPWWCRQETQKSGSPAQRRACTEHYRTQNLFPWGRNKKKNVSRVKLPSTMLTLTVPHEKKSQKMV